MRTGKQADQNMEEYLLNFIENGNTARDEFVRESLDDDERFVKPIKKKNVVNFATEHFMKRNKSAAVQAIAQVKGTRDLFGRLLSISISAKLDVQMLFQYFI